MLTEGSSELFVSSEDTLLERTPQDSVITWQFQLLDILHMTLRPQNVSVVVLDSQVLALCTEPTPTHLYPQGKRAPICTVHIKKQQIIPSLPSNKNPTSDF